MGRLYDKCSVNVSKAYPLDVKTVVESISDLTDSKLLKSTYEGLVVYVVEDKSLYVCFKKPKCNKLDNVEDGWKKVDVDYSVRIVESESNLIDGKTIMFPYQGIMAYVMSESSLYVLLTKGIKNAKDINNWKKISSSSSSTDDKIGIDVAPRGGTGFKITGNKDVIVDDFVNAESYIKSIYTYTSKGINSIGEINELFDYESVQLSKGGSSYIELYSKDNENWIKIVDPNKTLGLSVMVGDQNYVSGTLIKKGTPICFGVDVKFHDGWTISYGGISKKFDESDYELIDIYRSENNPEVYAYRKHIDVRLLTTDDLNDINDKVDNLINKAEPDRIEDSTIGDLFT